MTAKVSWCLPSCLALRLRGDLQGQMGRRDNKRWSGPIRVFLARKTLHGKFACWRVTMKVTNPLVSFVEN